MSNSQPPRSVSPADGSVTTTTNERMTLRVDAMKRMWAEVNQEMVDECVRMEQQTEDVDREIAQYKDACEQYDREAEYFLAKMKALADATKDSHAVKDSGHSTK